MMLSSLRSNLGYILRVAQKKVAASHLKKLMNNNLL